MKVSRRLHARFTIALLASAALVLACAGCFNPFDPRIASTRGIVKPPPLPNTPTGVLELFQWCWQNRAIAEYTEIFTDDYTFQFAELDSSGHSFQDRPWRREDEMASAKHLFVEGTSRGEAPASNITLNYNQSLVPYRDSRPGKAQLWHQQIRAQVTLRVYLNDNSEYEVKGAGLFYLTRGDSAKLPEELKNRGFLPDSNRWWIERWEDETLQGPGAFSARRAPPGTGVDPALNASVWSAGRPSDLAPTRRSTPVRAAPAPDLAGAPATRAAPPAALGPYLPVSWGKLKVVYRN